MFPSSQNAINHETGLRDEIDQHKYKVGQAVQYYAPRGICVPRGAYYVTAELPFRAGEFEYRIKHPDETYERVAPESALTRNPP